MRKNLTLMQVYNKIFDDECTHENITIDNEVVNCDDCNKDWYHHEFADMWAELKQANKDLKKFVRENVK